jgi:serine/threonine-protein kinase RsbW
MKALHPGNITQTPQPKSAGTSASCFAMTMEASMPSGMKAISLLVDQIMRLIELSSCIVGDESAVELALREALNNAAIHGNAMGPHQFVELRCRCDREKGMWLEVRDQGKGFDPNAVPDPLAPDWLEAVHGRGIHLMRSAMEEVSFEAGGTVVRMRKRAGDHGQTNCR